MIDSPTANFSGSEQALFTPGEIRALMGAEFERAARYRHPLACLFVGVDRIEQLTDFHGHASREEVLGAVVELLLSRLRVGDFLGLRERERFVLALPFTTADGARALGERLLSGARELVFECDGRTLRVSLSIGAAYAGRDGCKTFDELLGVAEKGMEQAGRAGGARFVEWNGEEVGSDAAFADLRKELEERMRVLRDSLHVAAPKPASVPTELTLAEKLQDLLVVELAQEDAVAEPSVAGERGTREAAGPGEDRESALQARIQELIAQHNRQIDVLERRIGKLTCSLEATEGELARMALLREVDPGLSSIYRTVQGLDSGASHALAKKEMMSAIFAANLELQEEITRRATGN